MSDIADNFNADQQLIQSEERYRDLVENINDFICTHDLEGNILSVNKAAEKALGYSRDQLLKMKIPGIMLSERQHLFDQYLSKIKLTGHAQGLMYVQTAAGENRIWEYNNSLHNNEKGQCIVQGVARDITDRKKAETALRNEKDRFEKIVNTVPGVIFTGKLEPDGTISIPYSSPSMLDMFGLKPEELAGDGTLLLQKIHPDDFEKTMKAILVSAHNMTEFQMEFRYNHPRKGWIWIDVHALPAADQDGSVMATGFLSDITERKKDEEKIKKSERKLQLTLDKMIEGILIVDFDLKYIYLNDHAEKVSQYPKEELIGYKMTEKYPGVEQTEIFKALIKCLHEREPQHLETEYVFPNGAAKWFQVSLQPVEEGAFILYFDITERKKAEKAISHSELKYRNVVENVHESLMIEDVDGNLIYANNEFSRMFGFSNDELPNLSLKDYTAEESYAEVIERHNRRMKGYTEPEEFEYKGRRKDGTEIWIECRVSTLIENGKIIGTQSLERDITERKRAEEEIKNTNEQLHQLTAHLQSIREEERKRIGREIHDELGQQLTAIKMDVAWIDKKTTDKTSLIRSKLKNIITLLDESNESVRRILSELRPAILNNYGLAEALEWQGGQFTSSTGIPVKFTITGPTIKLPEAINTCLFRVYQESLTNITRYARAKKVLTSVNINNDSITLIVEDDGKGIDTVAMQNKNKFGLLGMKERVRSLNGKFELVSVKNRGTKIIVSLPYTTSITT